jgi:hypothetical protein
VLGELGDAEERVPAAVVSWSSPTLGELAVVGVPAAAGIAFGLWRGRTDSRRVLIWVLVATMACVAASYALWIALRSVEGSPFGLYGMLLIALSVGLSGFALFANRALAALFSIVVSLGVVAFSGIAIVAGSCFLFATCI